MSAITLGEVATAPVVAWLSVNELLSISNVSFSLLGFLIKIAEPNLPLLLLKVQPSMNAFELPSRHKTPPSTSLLALFSKLDNPMSIVTLVVFPLTYITPPSSWAFSPKLFLMLFLTKLDRLTDAYLELFPTYIADPLTAVFCSKSHE